MAILALLNRKCFRGALRYNVRGCSGGVTPDLGGNFTGLVGVPLPIARPSPRTSWSCDTLKCRAGKAKTSPLVHSGPPARHRTSTTCPKPTSHRTSPSRRTRPSSRPLSLRDPSGSSSPVAVLAQYEGRWAITNKRRASVTSIQQPPRRPSAPVPHRNRWSRR